MTHISLEELLEIDREAAIDYEITFAALLATALLTIPDVSPILHPVVVASAFLLLAVTLIRRMAFLNPYSKDLLKRTTPPLVISTAFGLLYIGLVFGTFTQSHIPIIEPRASTLGLLYTVVFVLGSVLLYEAIFRDFFLLIAAFAYNIHLDHRGTLLGRLALRLSQKSLATSLLPEHEWPVEVQEIPSVNRHSPSDVSLRDRVVNVIGTFLGAMGMTLIFGLAFAGFYILASMVASQSLLSVIIDGMLLAIAVNFLIVSIRFLYGRYGQTPYVKIAPPKRYIYYSLILYVLYFVHVGFELGLSLSL
ncbi:hypothetical protein [Haloarcula brevis]|uniref:hypothetical protein n=1 Tax=Haloarcula brevis TaxID=3111453 RepID=UPI00300F2E23